MITDAGILSVVQNLKGLRSLNITEVARLTDLSLVYISRYCSKTLHTIILDFQSINRPTYSAGAINTFLEHCTKLSTLHIYGNCEGTRTTPFIFAPAAICNLNTLAIGGNIVSEQSLAVILKHAANMLVLEIDSVQRSAVTVLDTLVLSFLYAESLTDDICNALTILRPYIVHLDISNAGKITDGGILNIVQNLAGLRSFNIIGGTQLTDLSFKYIYTYRGGTLSTLLFDYQGMHGPTFSAIAITNIIERCTQLNTLHIYDWHGGAIPFTFPSSAVYHLTCLAIGGAIVTEQNLSVIATDAANLQVLEIDSEQ
eukprot:gene13721-15778_t